MRRLTWLLLFLLPSLAWGTDYFVDGGCTTNGNGTSETCGATGPYNSISNATGRAYGAGDRLKIRGAHAAHGGADHKCNTADSPADECTGNTWDGWYDAGIGGGRNQFSGKTGADGNPFIIEAYGWTAVGAWTQEKVYVQAAGDPGTWTQCSDCVTGPCAGVPGTCSETWYIDPTPGTMDRAEGAVKADGSMTFAVRRPEDLTNDHTGANGICAGCSTSSCPTSACSTDSDCSAYSAPNDECVLYRNATCSDAAWLHCDVDSDCPFGGTCSSTSAEIDSYTPGAAGATILVRWGGSLPENPDVQYSTFSTNCFQIAGSSSWITVRGFICRLTRDSGMEATGTSTNIVFQDNLFIYQMGAPNGGDYGVVNRTGSDPFSVLDNHFAYGGSESYHGTARTADAATTVTFQRNFIRNASDKRVMGPAARGTPLGMILADAGGGAGASGNYTGSVVSDNVILRMKSGQNRAGGISLENHSDNWTIRDNVIGVVDGIGIQGGANVSGNAIFNNLIYGWAQRSGGQGGIDLQGGATFNLNDNLIWNNTLIDTKGATPGIFLRCGGAASCTGNVVRNNIFYNNSSGAGLKVADLFEVGTTFTNSNNLHRSLNLAAGSTLVTILGSNYTCANVESGCSTNCADSKCQAPVFVNEGTDDYHLQTSSPAKDAGTSTGMPAGRTTDINNTLADDHGLPSYADADACSGVCDIGVDEFISSARRRIIVTTSP